MLSKRKIGHHFAGISRIQRQALRIPLLKVYTGSVSHIGTGSCDGYLGEVSAVNAGVRIRTALGQHGP